jgi:hypothetical protein
MHSINQKVERRLIEKLVSLRTPYLGEAEFALALLGAPERNENASSSGWRIGANPSLKVARSGLTEALALPKSSGKLWSELNGLPARIEKATNEVESISKSSSELDVNAARNEYKQFFRAIIDGAKTDPLEPIRWR